MTAASFSTQETLIVLKQPRITACHKHISLIADNIIFKMWVKLIIKLIHTIKLIYKHKSKERTNSYIGADKLYQDYKFVVI